MLLIWVIFIFDLLATQLHNVIDAHQFSEFFLLMIQFNISGYINMHMMFDRLFRRNISSFPAVPEREIIRFTAQTLSFHGPSLAQVKQKRSGKRGCESRKGKGKESLCVCFPFVEPIGPCSQKLMVRAQGFLLWSLGSSIIILAMGAICSELQFPIVLFFGSV